MCGIAGLLDTRAAADGRSLEARAAAMGATLVHRGPDASGTWADPDAGVALAHRRLSIVDLSAAGAQPMRSPDGRYVLTYNGEVYNSTELREALSRDRGGDALRFAGHSDTETIVAGFQVWGIRATIERLIGMFALAVWDRRERRLTLVRDRLGIKPLYVAHREGLMLFGSEPKALLAHPECPGEIDRDALAGFLRHGYVLGPRTAWRGMEKLAPGEMLAVEADGRLRRERYWRLDEVAARGRAAPFAGDDAEALEALRATLGDAVGRRMVADVPLGAFLSGGIDSSTVVALMQERSSVPIRTFAIGFEEAGYDESPHAAAVAAHLGTEHTELYATHAMARELIPELPALFDEPFADPSQLPTLLVSRLTRRHVTVSLSGDGGDELFGGYERYAIARRYARLLLGQPHWLRRLEAVLIGRIGPGAWNRLARVLPGRLAELASGDKLQRLPSILADGGRAALYRGIASHSDRPESLVPGASDPPSVFTEVDGQWMDEDFLSAMQYVDMAGYLPDDILAKVDRASMAVSLEARVPLLDHRVVELAWTLPGRFKERDRQSKWLLRQLLYGHVPRALIDRPKMGFGVPIGQWLRGPLRDWADDLLGAEALRRTGLLDGGRVQALWADHRSGRVNREYLVWDLLMLQAWALR